MKDALISVIVPVYKVEAFLAECVQSIVDQTYQNLEIILVDDGSPDQCGQMCDTWAQRDSRIKVIHKENEGLSAARNAGLDIATGEYIGFVDSDDFIAPDMYEKLYTALKAGKSGIACCSAYIVSEDGTVMRLNKAPQEATLNVNGALNATFCLQADTSVWSKLYGRNIFEDLRFPVGETNEDFPLIVPTIVKAKGMTHVQQCLYYYRQRKGSITKASIPDEKNSGLVYKNLLLIEDQLRTYGIRKNRKFGFFAAQFSFSRALSYEKKYEYLSDKLKKDYKLYRAVMIKNIVPYMFTMLSSVKDKILYLMVLTKLLRPLYRVLYKNHL